MDYMDRIKSVGKSVRDTGLVLLAAGAIGLAGCAQNRNIVGGLTNDYSKRTDSMADHPHQIPTINLYGVNFGVRESIKETSSGDKYTVLEFIPHDSMTLTTRNGELVRMSPNDVFEQCPIYNSDGTVKDRSDLQRVAQTRELRGRKIYLRGMEGTLQNEPKGDFPTFNEQNIKSLVESREILGKNFFTPYKLSWKLGEPNTDPFPIRFIEGDEIEFRPQTDGDGNLTHYHLTLRGPRSKLVRQHPQADEGKSYCERPAVTEVKESADIISRNPGMIE